jgi:hypothetical protein
VHRDHLAGAFCERDLRVATWMLWSKQHLHDIQDRALPGERSVGGILHRLLHSRSRKEADLLAIFTRDRVYEFDQALDA